jgi:integrase
MPTISLPLPTPVAAPAADGHAAHRPRRKELTAVAIEKMRPRPYRFEVGDGRAQGLRLLVSPNGHKSFIVRFRFGGRPKKYTIGPVTIGLKAARSEAARVIFDVARGVDPTAVKREAKAEQRREADAVRDTFRGVAERFLQLEGPKLRSADERRRTLERLVYPTLGSRPISDIRRSEIVRLLDAIEQKNGAAMAHMTLAYLRRVMSWHATRSDDFKSPVVRGMGRVNPKERARSRVLGDDEIRAIWKAADGIFGSYVKFLLLTGARRSEAAEMRFEEITGSEWTLPGSRNKTKVDLTRPLSAAAMEVLANLPRTNDTFGFSMDGVHPLSGFARPKRALDEKSGTSGWTLHDLRRTARTLLARAGVSAEIAERCVGHVLPGIQAVYNHHDYRLEMQKAFEALALTIEQIINPPPEGKVIRMQRG